jgi:Holliday junction resolvasome RuvABC DNA-binding subunit
VLLAKHVEKGSHNMKTYLVKATISLVFEDTVQSKNHKEAKSEVLERLIRMGFKRPKIQYITTKVVEDNETE